MRILITFVLAAAALGLPVRHTRHNHGHHALEAPDLESETDRDSEELKLRRLLAEKQLRSIALFLTLQAAEERGEDLERYDPSVSADFERMDEDTVMAMELKVLRAFYLDVVAAKAKPKHAWEDLERNDPEEHARELKRIEMSARIPTDLGPAELRAWFLDAERRGFFSSIWDKISGTYESLSGSVTEQFGQFSDNMVKPMIERASKAMTRVWKSVTAKITGVVTSIQSGLTAVWARVKKIPSVLKRYVKHYVQEKLLLAFDGLSESIETTVAAKLCTKDDRMEGAVKYHECHPCAYAPKPRPENCYDKDGRPKRLGLGSGLSFLAQLAPEEDVTDVDDAVDNADTSSLTEGVGSELAAIEH